MIKLMEIELVDAVTFMMSTMTDPMKLVMSPVERDEATLSELTDAERWMQ